MTKAHDSGNGHGANARTATARVDFSRIRTSLLDPEPDRRAAALVRALPADEPAPRGAGQPGPAGGVHLIFPFSDFRETCSLDFVKYSIGDWQCKCGELQGPRVPAHDLHQLRRQGDDRSPARGDGHLHRLRRGQQEPRHQVRHLRQPGRAAAQVLDLRVPGARHDLRRAAQGHLPAVRLRQGSRDRDPHDARRQGGGGLLRRDPADDGQRHVHHQRHRARHRLPAPPQPGRLLHQGGAAHLPRQDHPLPRLVGGVRVRPEGHPVGAHRPQAQVPRHRVPARPRPRDATSRSCASSTSPVPVQVEGPLQGQGHAHRPAAVLEQERLKERQTPRPPRDLPDLRRHRAHQGEGRASSKSGESARRHGRRRASSSAR